MKDAVLIELAARWERDAKEPQCQDGAVEAVVTNAKAQGARETLRMCADTIRSLVHLLGDGEDDRDRLARAVRRAGN